MATSLALLVLLAPPVPLVLPAGLALPALLAPPVPRRPLALLPLLALLPPRRLPARNFNQSKSKRETPHIGAFFMGAKS